MTLYELRNIKGLSQKQVSEIINVPIRTYRRYESDNNYGSDIKRKSFIHIIEDYFTITEDKGLLTVDYIKNKLTDLFNDEYFSKIDYCYLFGSYAKGIAKENSDVDLYISTDLQGLEFVGLIEKIRTLLNKKVDVIRNDEMINNIELIKEIMKGGIKIYG